MKTDTVVYEFQGIKTRGVALRIGDTFQSAIQPSERKAHILMKDGRSSLADRECCAESAIESQSMKGQLRVRICKAFRDNERMRSRWTGVDAPGLNRRNKLSNLVKRCRLG